MDDSERSHQRTTNTVESSENRRTFLRAAGVAAGIFAIPGTVHAGPPGRGGGPSGEAPVIEQIEVWVNDDDQVVADYEVSDADGDLDYVALGVIDRNRTVGSDYEDISGKEAVGTLQTDALEPGKYKWVFAVVDEAKHTDTEKGTVTV